MKQNIFRGGLAVLAALAPGLLLTGCLVNEAPIEPPAREIPEGAPKVIPKEIPRDTVPPGVQETETVVRDFAPIAVGNVWTYRHVHDNSGIHYPDGVWGEWSDTTWFTFRITGVTHLGEGTAFTYRKIRTQGGLTDSLEIDGTAEGDTVAMGPEIQRIYDWIYQPWHVAHSVSATLAAPAEWNGRPHFSATVVRNAPDNIGTAVVMDGIGMISAVFDSHRAKLIFGFTKTTVTLEAFTPGG